MRAPIDVAHDWAQACDRAADAQDSHHAFIAVADASRRPSARVAGPLSGVPFVVKDNIDTADLPTSGGTPLLRGSRPTRDAAVVASLRRAGAELVGKTNLHELAFGITSDNAAFGTVLNPYDRSRSPGGSSGGSAVAVALGVVPFALGTDTGGSVRVPAAHCGVVGFRPTTGRYRADGLLRLSGARDTVGVLAASVHDVSVVDGALVGREPALPTRGLRGARLGVPIAGFVDPADPTTALAFEQAVDRLVGAGAQVVEVDFSEAQRLDAECGFPLVLAEAPLELSRYLSVLQGPCAGVTFHDLVAGVASADVAQLLAGIVAEPVPPSTYQEALRVRRRLQRRHAELFDEHALDALIYPTVPFPAPPVVDGHETLLLGELVPLFATTIRNAAPSSVAGTPSVSVPCAPGSALPVGLSVEGRAHDDLRVLGLAAAVQAVLDPDTRPSITPAVS